MVCLEKYYLNIKVIQYIIFIIFVSFVLFFFFDLYTDNEKKVIIEILIYICTQTHIWTKVIRLAKFYLVLKNQLRIFF